MGLLKRLFRRLPRFSIYIDRSSKGNYSARLVDAKMQTIFLTPVASRYAIPRAAVQGAVKRLGRMGVDADRVDVYVEDEGGNPIRRNNLLV